MTIEEIDRQISALKQQRNELEKKKREIFLESAQANVGRCFIVNDATYVKVLDVPQVEWTMTGSDFNQYQYPAIYITQDEVPFEFKTFFSGAWGEEYDSFNHYKEITQEEFNAKFDEVIKEFSNKVKNNEQTNFNTSYRASRLR